MKSVKILCLISEIALYFFTALCLGLAVWASVAGDSLGEISVGLQWAGQIGWLSLAFAAATSLFSIIVGANENKKGDKRVRLRTGIYQIFAAAELTVGFIVEFVLIIALAFAKEEYSFMDKLGFMLFHLPIMVTLICSLVACWIKTFLMRQLLDEVSLQNPYLKRNKGGSIALTIVYSVTTAVLLFAWIFIVILGFSI